MNDDEKRICAELWDEHGSFIRRMCEFKLISSPDEIDDVVGDVCLALCKMVSESGPPENPRAWLFKVFSNLLNGKYREIYAKREKETEYLDEEYDFPFRDNSIQQKENQIHFEELMKKAEGRLKEDDYEMLGYIYAGYKAKEIAKILNKSEAAVKQKRYRICKKMREIENEMKK